MLRAVSSLPVPESSSEPATLCDIVGEQIHDGHDLQVTEKPKSRVPTLDAGIAIHPRPPTPLTIPYPPPRFVHRDLIDPDTYYQVFNDVRPSQLQKYTLNKPMWSDPAFFPAACVAMCPILDLIVMAFDDGSLNFVSSEFGVCCRPTIMLTAPAKYLIGSENRIVCMTFGNRIHIWAVLPSNEMRCLLEEQYVGDLPAIQSITLTIELETKSVSPIIATDEFSVRFSRSRNGWVFHDYALPPCFHRKFEAETIADLERELFQARLMANRASFASCFPRLMTAYLQCELFADAAALMREVAQALDERVRSICGLNPAELFETGIELLRQFNPRLAQDFQSDRDGAAIVESRKGFAKENTERILNGLRAQNDSLRKSNEMIGRLYQEATQAAQKAGQQSLNDQKTIHELLSEREGPYEQVESLKSQIASLKDEIKEKDTIIAEYKCGVGALRAQNQALREELEQAPTYHLFVNREVCERFPFYDNLVKHTMSWSRWLATRRDHLDGLSLRAHTYDARLCALYAYFGYHGLLVSRSLQVLFGFPCHRHLIDMRKRVLHPLLADKKIFNGSLDSIRLLKGAFLPNERCRIVVGSDATFLKAYFGVSRTAEPSGTLSVVSHEAVDAACVNSAQFLDLLAHQELIKAVFVVLAIPLRPRAAWFPIAVVLAGTGSANPQIRALIDYVIQNARDAGFDVIAHAVDGDRGYASASIDFYAHLNASLKNLLSRSLSEIPLGPKEVPQDTLICYDFLHLLKNDKSARIRVEPKHVIPECPESAISSQDLRAIGVASWILDEDSYRQMDEFLALALFTYENIRKAYETRRYALFLALLPSYLFQTAILQPNLSRQDRVTRISVNFALIYYYCLLEERIRPGSKRKKSFTKNAVWTAEFARKSLILALFDLKEILRNEDLNLGALGTHYNEHYFGLLEKCQGNVNTADSFVQACVRAMNMKALMAHLGVEVIRSKHVSDSGATVSGSDRAQATQNLGRWLKFAQTLFQLVNSKVDLPILRGFESPLLIDDFMRLIQSQHVEMQEMKFQSTAKLRVPMSRNMKQRASLESQHQIQAITGQSASASGMAASVEPGYGDEPEEDAPDE
jgi:hypothetical protein